MILTLNILGNLTSLKAILIQNYDQPTYLILDLLAHDIWPISNRDNIEWRSSFKEKKKPNLSSIFNKFFCQTLISQFEFPQFTDFCIT